jgi:glycosyltransferase involved in cell wall biosynthesis
VKKIIYCGQFHDLTGYGIAARSYLKALDSHISNCDDVELKVYSVIIQNDVTLSGEDKSLIDKYTFKSDQELEEYINNNDYICLWHTPTPLPLFADERFKTTKDLTNSLKRLIDASVENYHLVVWETTDICDEWKETIEYFNPNGIITACDFNRPVFEKYNSNVKVIPHPIVQEVNDTPEQLNVPYQLDDKFCILTMSQWTYRKGFDKIISAFLMEFENEEDAALIVKTYPSPTHPTAEHIIKDIQTAKTKTDNPKTTKSKIVLVTDFIGANQMQWLFNKSDVYASATRGEGFGLTLFESVLNKIPVVAPRAGGHIDYLSEDSSYLVDGMYDCCITSDPVYSQNSLWFETNIASLRKQLRNAYNDWKQGNLKQKGLAGYEYLQSLEHFKPESVGKNIVDFLSTKEDRTINSKLAAFSQLSDKLEYLKDKHKGETLYILNCGPSLNEYHFDYLKEQLEDKTVFAIKQAYNYFPEITDYHFFNCSNLPIEKGLKKLTQHYSYAQNRPVTIASSNYDVGMRWSKIQKHDIFFKIPIRTEINNEFITVTKKFEDFVIDKNLTRPCGPGIMYETVFYMAVHLGFKEIVLVGWDLRQKDANEDNYEHFYGTNDDVFNKGDVLDWEIKTTCDASKELYYWLKEKEIDIKVASSSAVYEKIERIRI